MVDTPLPAPSLCPSPQLRQGVLPAPGAREQLHAAGPLRAAAAVQGCALLRFGGQRPGCWLEAGRLVGVAPRSRKRARTQLASIACCCINTSLWSALTAGLVSAPPARHRARGAAAAPQGAPLGGGHCGGHLLQGRRPGRRCSHHWQPRRRSAGGLWIGGTVRCAYVAPAPVFGGDVAALDAAVLRLPTFMPRGFHAPTKLRCTPPSVQLGV